MKRVRSLLRVSMLGVPLLAGGCAGEVVSGPETADPSCGLLCVLRREFVGDPGPAPPAAAPVPVKPPAKRPAARPAAAAARNLPKHAPAQARLRPAHRPPPPQVSVVPQAPAREPPPAPAAMVPPGPAPVAVVPPPPPAEPARSLTQSIPGSVGIVAPGWQNR